MAVSADGFLARSATDDMRWLGQEDKRVFRVLSGVGGMLGASVRTASLMPRPLDGRDLWELSRDRVTLQDFADNSGEDGWLLGGPGLAVEAFERRLLHEVHLCRSRRRAFASDELARCCTSAYPDVVTPMLRGRQGRVTWAMTMSTDFGDLVVEKWQSRVDMGAPA